MSNYNGGWIETNHIVGVYGERSITIGSKRLGMAGNAIFYEEIIKKVDKPISTQKNTRQMYYFDSLTKTVYRNIKEISRGSGIDRESIIKELKLSTKHKRFHRAYDREKFKDRAPMGPRKKSILDASTGIVYCSINTCSEGAFISIDGIRSHLYRDIKKRRFFIADGLSAVDKKILVDDYNKPVKKEDKIEYVPKQNWVG